MPRYVSSPSMGLAPWRRSVFALTREAYSSTAFASAEVVKGRPRNARTPWYALKWGEEELYVRCPLQ